MKLKSVWAILFANFIKLYEQQIEKQSQSSWRMTVRANVFATNKKEATKWTFPFKSISSD